MRLAACLVALLPGLAAAQSTCGGDFGAFVDGLKREAVARGYDAAFVERFFAPVRQDPAVLRADSAQGVFQLPFIEFSRRLISQNRLQNGARMAQRHAAVFDAIERRYGVNRGILLAFWGFETDFGQVQGDFNTVNALTTLAHDCRRPELFRPQVFAALELYRRGALDPARTTGAWAGEIGRSRCCPRDILENGQDADGDGVVSLKTSVPDALVSGAAMLRALGWRPNEPWLQEVVAAAGLRLGADGPRREAQRRGLGADGRRAATGPGRPTCRPRSCCRRGATGRPSSPTRISTSSSSGTAASSTSPRPPISRPGSRGRRSTTPATPLRPFRRPR